MSQQSSRPGFAPARATDRLFLAIFPDHQTAGRLSELALLQRARHGLSGRMLDVDRLHVTLFHLGDWVGLRDEIITATERAASQVVARPFDVTFDQVASFGGRREKLPFVLKADAGNAPLRAFRTQLGHRLGEAGLAKYVSGTFEPHVTLAYDSRQVPADLVASITWHVREFSLVHSLLGRTQHRRLRSWTLTTDD